MSNLEAHARKELELAGLFDKDSDYGGVLGPNILALIQLLASQGHSGASADMTISAFERLARFNPLTPLTGADDEWHDPVDEGPLQNLRSSHVFKDKKTGKAYDAAISAEEITFPYMPETP